MLEIKRLFFIYNDTFQAGGDAHGRGGGCTGGGEGGCTCILCIPPGYAPDPFLCNKKLMLVLSHFLQPLVIKVFCAEDGENNGKKHLYKCVSEFNFVSPFDSGFSNLSRKVKIVAP
jgi:hypothetical protein